MSKIADWDFSNCDTKKLSETVVEAFKEACKEMENDESQNKSQNEKIRVECDGEINE